MTRLLRTGTLPHATHPLCLPHSLTSAAMTSALCPLPQGLNAGCGWSKQLTLGLGWELGSRLWPWLLVQSLVHGKGRKSGGGQVATVSQGWKTGLGDKAIGLVRPYDTLPSSCFLCYSSLGPAGPGGCEPGRSSRNAMVESGELNTCTLYTCPVLSFSSAPSLLSGVSPQPLPCLFSLCLRPWFPPRLTVGLGGPSCPTCSG